MHFWAKTTSENKPGTSVFGHMGNVGCVARAIAEKHPALIARLGLGSSEIGALAALHDLGKISPGFQRKCESWLEENGLSLIAKNGCWDTVMEANHGRITHSSLQSFLNEKGVEAESAKFISAAIGGHHGRINQPNDRGYKPPGQMNESPSGIDWASARNEAAKKIWEHFGSQGALLELDSESPALWWLAGITTVSDWIGSNEDFFPTEIKTKKFDPALIAENALTAIGFQPPKIIKKLSFQDIFKFVPNCIQIDAMEAIKGPGVYVIEAPMGMGKTEAALGAAYKLLELGKATGIFFALPTQATSNRIHIRMVDFIKNITEKTVASRLIHGNSWLMAEVAGISPSRTGSVKGSEDARLGRDWFASSKRALLAPFGVGTVDQALLGVVAAKHFFVRQFALAGKVVIIDEVHSYDVYTGSLINTLIKTLEGLGCTVIVLSATLTKKRQGQIITNSDNANKGFESPYPLITGRMDGKPIVPIASTPPESRVVKVDFITSMGAMEKAIIVARAGGTVLWICNTVDVAQNQYRKIKAAVKMDFPVGLLHSRFPFWRREELEIEWMDRFGKIGQTRCGSILVSTQIVEQSVDLDADLMISELAPTDMLLQRLGRLWRHQRESRPVSVAQIFIIEEERSLEEFRNADTKTILEWLGSKAYVYAPFVLLRSLEVWKATLQISIPLQIRRLIESTYSVRDREPESWEKLYEEWFGTDSAKKMVAARNSNLWQVALEDEEGVQTRLNEMPTVNLVLYKSIKDQEIIFLDNSKCKFGGDTYSFEMAKGTHKNLVKAPRYLFDSVETSQPFSEYLHGAQGAVILEGNGYLEINEIKNGVLLFYSDELGLVVEKEPKGKEL